MAEKKITDLEAAATEKLRVELQTPLMIAMRVFNLISPLINLPGTKLPKDLFVRSLLLQRVQNDLRSTMILAEKGYSLQASSLAAGIFEGFATIGAIAEEANAEQWLAHDKEEISFGSVLKLTKKSFQNIAGSTEGAEPIYAIYQQLCT
jgi:hypothetical protein